VAGSDIRTHEVTFCGRVAGWANAFFTAHPELPFRRAEIEESKSTKRKRSDLRVYGDAGKLILAGEVKMPGTKEGLSPYNTDLVADAASKADNAAAEFFFTWNVNTLVLFDRKKWQLPIFERRVQEYPLGIDLESPDAGVESAIKEFLSNFFIGLAGILTGQQPEWGMRFLPRSDAFNLRVLRDLLLIRFFFFVSFRVFCGQKRPKKPVFPPFPHNRKK
jgi:hypothetical protein